MIDRAKEECPECGMEGYLIVPSYRDCQTCLRLRLKQLDERFSDGNP